MINMIVKLLFISVRRNVHKITSTTSLPFCLSSALWQQLRSLLCACCHALKTNKNPAPVVKLISCAILTINFAFAAPAKIDYLKQSQIAIEAGKIYIALDLLQQAEQQSNLNYEEQWLINIALTDALIKTGNTEEVKKKLDTLYQQVKKANNPAILSEIMLRFGHLASIQNNKQKAKDWYQKALQSALIRKDHPQITAILIDLSKVSTDDTLLALSAEHIQYIDQPALKQQLSVSLGYQATQKNQIQIAHHALQNVLDQPYNSRLKSEAQGQLGKLYAQQNRVDEALQLTEQALLSDSSEDLQLRWNWQRARLLAKNKNIDQAILAFRTAVQQLQQLRINVPVVYHDGKSSFNQTFAPLYKDYINTLLQRAEHSDETQNQPFLTEVIQAWEQLKAVELQGYFRDACTVKQQQENTALETGTAMLYPIILPDHLALVVRFSDHIKAYSVPQSSKKIEDLAKGFSRDLYTGVYKLKAKMLYQWLIAPIANDLQQQNIHTLVYLPDGPLRKIPFALLNNGEKYLTEQYALVTVPGLSMLAKPSTKLNKNDLLLAGMSEAGPVVEELINNKINFFGESVAEQFALSESNPAQQINKMKKRLALPGVNQELKALSTLSDVPVMKNSQFLLKNFKQTVHKGHSFIHIASHGFFSGDPKKSFIMTYDHLLTIQQLSELFQTEAFNNQPIEMMTLSACRTAKGDDRSPLGLSGVVVQTGVKSAIGSLWPVADKASTQFFSSFYKFYQKTGVTKAQALQQAQQNLLHSNEFSHPFYWASFVLVGEWH